MVVVSVPVSLVSCKRAHSHTETPAMTSLSEVRTNGCPKCGSIKKSSKLSCCAHGGAWFKNCGDAGDRQFDHTWGEGIQACKGSSLKDWVLCHVSSLC